MTAPHFPDFIDFIDEILKHLQNDHSTLFTCLLINRIWCARAVPLLYENPFEKIFIYKPKAFNLNEIINKNKHSIIWTLILCFDKMELSSLKNRSKPYIKMIYFDEYKPLFEYPKYIKYFDDTKIVSIIYIN